MFIAKFGEFSVIICLSTFSALCSLPTTSMTLRTGTCGSAGPWGSVQLFFFFFFNLFSFCGSDWVISIVLYSTSPILSFGPSILRWTCLWSFLFHLFYFSVLLFPFVLYLFYLSNFSFLWYFLIYFEHICNFLLKHFYHACFILIKSF